MTDDQQPQPAIVIKTVDNGPYQIKGPIQVVDHDNNKYDIGAGAIALPLRSFRQKTVLRRLAREYRLPGQ